MIRRPSTSSHSAIQIVLDKREETKEEKKEEKEGLYTLCLPIENMQMSAQVNFENLRDQFNRHDLEQTVFHDLPEFKQYYELIRERLYRLQTAEKQSGLKAPFPYRHSTFLTIAEQENYLIDMFSEQKGSPEEISYRRLSTYVEIYHVIAKDKQFNQAQIDFLKKEMAKALTVASRLPEIQRCINLSKVPRLKEEDLDRPEHKASLDVLVEGWDSNKMPGFIHRKFFDKHRRELGVKLDESKKAVEAAGNSTKMGSELPSDENPAIPSWETVKIWIRKNAPAPIVDREVETGLTTGPR
jgi:hypothetical protein